jgi:(2Fe-2S) ferredoxin
METAGCLSACPIPDIEDLDPAECGFDRPLDGPFGEVHGSIKPIACHLLVATAVPPQDWPEEASEASPLLKAIAAVKLPKPLVLSSQLFFAPDLAGGAGDGPAPTVLAYPARVALTGVTPATAAAVIDCLRQENLSALPSGVTAAPLTDFHVFVCAHRRRDKRCGYCGPVLYAEFEKELHVRRLGDVRLYKVSHVGGHKYAGNVLMYGPALLDWYGYVGPSDVRELINLAIVREEWVPRLWRGRVGPSAEEADRLRDLCRQVTANR